jgi:autotransporter family porin
VHADGSARGIYAQTARDSSIGIVNSADVTVIAGGTSRGIDAFVFAPRTSGRNISLENSGAIEVVSTEGSAQGIRARIASVLTDTFIDIVNQGDVSVTAAVNADGIYARLPGPLSIVNSGDIDASGTVARGIYAGTFANNYSGLSTAIAISNTGRISAGTGIQALTSGNATVDGGNAGIAIHNAGDVFSNGVVNAGAIYTATLGSAVGENSNVGIAIDNTGELTAVRGGIVAGVFGSADGAGSNAGIAISNAGAINALYGVYAVTKGNANGDGSNVGIAISNSGAITGSAVAILARSYGSANGAGSNAGINIENSGSAFGGTGAGIYAYSNTATTIINSGYVSGASLLAIQANGPGNATIYNSGLITGFILLDADDTFINERGGVFETKLVSDFGAGNDLFRNEQGGTVLAASNAKAIEWSSFVGLERFENAGLISLQDGQAGDSFEISNTIGARDLSFVASSGSTLAIDAFLGGPGSTADNLIINGDISGKTELKVNNTNTGPGTFAQAIPVIYANGNVSSDAFFLNQPIDTGFFNYDLFFRPTGSGVFELRSFLGAGAFVLPQLETAAQDIWHEGSDTWFDRSTDLRVLLNGGGAAPLAYGPDGAPGAAPAGNMTPAVWARGSGNWLDREDSESVSAYGRSYKYNLNRDLETVDFQSGIDLGKRGLLSDNDILVFGALGGFIHSDLDYDAINRLFSFEGGQVGGYATYLRGGLFVDTLVNVHLMEVETRTLGFPNSLDATTVGVRTDSGYRFG